MRRSMATMLATLGALSTPLAAQSGVDSGAVASTRVRGGAYSLGLAATIGQSWQFEAAEIGYVRRRPHGAIGGLSVSARLGSFIDQGVILGGSRGFLFGATVAARSATAKVAEIGDEQNLTLLGLDVTLEASGYLAAKSPLPQGSQWAAVSLLPALRIGSGDGPRYAVMVGPTVFIGKETEWRGLLALRVETPLARGGAHP